MAPTSLLKLNGTSQILVSFGGANKSSRKFAVNSLNALSVGVEPCVEPQDGNGYPKSEYSTGFTR